MAKYDVSLIQYGYLQRILRKLEAAKVAAGQNPTVRDVVKPLEEACADLDGFCKATKPAKLRKALQ